MIHFRFILAAVLLTLSPSVLTLPAGSGGDVSSSPAAKSSGSPTQTSSAAQQSITAGTTSDDPNDSFWDEYQSETPEAIRGTLGATVIGPQNVELDRQSPDFLAPPSTDNGGVDNAKWPFSLSHNRLQTGGWARQQNVGVMPLADQMAGVNMRLELGAIRELHWHATAEWGYVFKGTVRVTAVNADGQNYEADTNPGDVWYFPPGIPHSLQAVNDTSGTKDGAEFLLVFDDGTFSEDDTFLLTDWVAHIPKEVLAKNFHTDISAFSNIPAKQLYIFPGPSPPSSIEQDQPKSPSGTVPSPFSFAWSQSKTTNLAGGTVKVLDSTTFPVSKTIAAAEVTINKGGMRELHWHPTQAEWTYYISGNARVTLFASSSNARTFNYQSGDVGYVPPGFGHYVENIGNDTVHFLEIFKTDKFSDISLNQWLALVPPELVKAHLNVDDNTLAHFNKTKQTVV